MILSQFSDIPDIVPTYINKFEEALSLQATCVEGAERLIDVHTNLFSTDVGFLEMHKFAKKLRTTKYHSTGSEEDYI